MAMKRFLEGTAMEPSMGTMGRSSSISSFLIFVDPQSLFLLQITRLESSTAGGFLLHNLRLSSAVIESHQTQAQLPEYQKRLQDILTQSTTSIFWQ